MNRRDFIVSCTKTAPALFLLLPVASCKNKDSQTSDPCSDLSAVSAEEIQSRKSYNYVAETPITEKHCKNCEFWLEPEEGSSCGGCDLFEGPVHSNGYCTAWSEA